MVSWACYVTMCVICNDNSSPHPKDLGALTDILLLGLSIHYFLHSLNYPCQMPPGPQSAPRSGATKVNVIVWWGRHPGEQLETGKHFIERRTMKSQDIGKGGWRKIFISGCPYLEIWQAAKRVKAILSRECSRLKEVSAKTLIWVLMCIHERRGIQRGWKPGRQA